MSFQSRYSKSANIRARELFERAIELDPEFAAAYAALSLYHFRAWGLWWTDDPDVLDRALDVANRAVALDDTLPLAHVRLGWILLWKGQHGKAIASQERAIALDPSYADAYHYLAATLAFAGKGEEGIEMAKKAMRLNPNGGPNYPFHLGLTHYVAGQYEEAMAALERTRTRDPDFEPTYRYLAAIYVEWGQMEEAQAAVKEILRLTPNASLESWSSRHPFKDRTVLDQFVANLRKAGLPENPPLKLPDKPSIAVLPFTNMSNDAEQEYFVDGMTDDLITDLSKLSGLFVIARNSSFTYKGKTVDVKQVARELGVRYVLEGSVRRAAEQVRINAQLIDATTGGHLWAERYDGALDDVFALQDKVTRSIVTSLAVNLTAGEQRQQAWKETDIPEAYDAFLRGWAHYQLNTPDDFASAIPYLENAIELDPNFGRAHAVLAAIYWEARDNEWEKSVGLTSAEISFKVKQYLLKAMRNPTPLAHRIAAKVHSDAERWDEAMTEAERAITIDPNDPNGYLAMSILLVDVGRSAEGLDFIQKAIRLDPQSNYLFTLGDAQFHLERYDEAAATLLRATKRNPSDASSFLLLAAAYGHLGREQKARSAIDTFNTLRLEVGSRPYTLADIDDWDFKDPVDRERVRVGLRNAGLPEGEVGPQREPLTAEDLRSAFPGNTSTGESVYGGKWHIHYMPDGTLLYRPLSGQTERGTWEITDDGRFCRQWSDVGAGNRKCWIYFKEGDVYEYWYPDRSRMRGKFRIRPGNPENL